MNMGGRTYPVRYYPVAIRLRDREGRAILCIALFPQSGDSSGAILGVRSVALLHEATVALRRIMRTSSLRRVALLYLRGHRHCPWAIPPRSYCHPTQPKYNQISPKSELFARFVCICAYFFVPLRDFWRFVFYTQESH